MKVGGFITIAGNPCERDVLGYTKMNQPDHWLSSPSLPRGWWQGTPQRTKQWKSSGYSGLATKIQDSQRLQNQVSTVDGTQNGLFFTCFFGKDHVVVHSFRSLISLPGVLADFRDQLWVGLRAWISDQKCVGIHGLINKNDRLDGTFMFQGFLVALKNPWETQKDGVFVFTLNGATKICCGCKFAFSLFPQASDVYWFVGISVRIIFTTFNQSTCCSSVTSTSARMNMFLDMILTHGIHVWYIYLYLP